MGPVGKEPADPNAGDPDKASAELEGAIATEIRRQLQMERAIVKDALNLAFKIVTAAVALLIVVFTVFGITTWRDIANHTQQYMRHKVDSLVQSAGSRHSVANRLNTLFNRAIVYSTLIRLKKEGSNGDVELSYDDWERIRRWVEKKDTSLKDFKDALAVLNLQSRSRKDKDALSIFAKMLDPSHASKFDWTSNQPKKRLAILLGFKNDNLGPSVTRVATDKNLENSIRSVAVKYLVTIAYKDSFTTLISLANFYHGNELGVEAAAAAIVLQPAQEKSSEIVENMLSAKTHRRLTDVALMLSQVDTMLSKLMPEGSDGLSLDEVKLLHKYEGRLLEFLLRNGSFLTNSSFLVGRYYQQYLYLWIPPRKHSDVIDFNRRHSRIRFRLTLQGLARLTSYWSALDNDAAHDNLTDLRRRMIRIDARPPITLLPETYEHLRTGDLRFDVGVKFSSGSGAVVQLYGGGGNFKLHSDAEILLFASGRDIDVNWWDNSRYRSGKLIKFYGSSFQFYLENNGIVK